MPREIMADAELYALVRQYDAPEYVKTASDEALRGHDGVPRHCYADQAGQQFPVHTAAATWLSAASYLTKAAGWDQTSHDPVFLRLFDHAHYWGIQQDLVKLAGQIKTAAREDLANLPDGDFGFIEAFGDGRRERHLPLRNTGEVKIAAQWLIRHGGSFTYEDRRLIADRILSKAAAYTADLGADQDAIEKMAGFGTCATAQAVDFLKERALLLDGKHNASAEGLRKLAGVLASQRGQLDGALLTDVAATVDRIDQETGLASRYGEIARPEEVLFGVTQKLARDFAEDHVELLTGSIYKKSDLARLSVNDLRDRLGDHIAEAISESGVMVDPEKLAAVLPTLTRPDAAAFDRAVAELGASPIMKTAGTRPRVDLQELAAAG